MVSHREQPTENPQPYFTLLPEKKSRPGTYVAAVALEAGFILLILAIIAIFPQKAMVERQNSYVPLYLNPVRQPPPRVRIHPIRPPRVAAVRHPTLAIPRPMPKVEPKRARIAAAPVMNEHFRSPTILYRPNAPARPRPVIHTGVLNSEVAKVTPPRAHPRPAVRTGVLTSAVGRLAPKQTRGKVQTGGFGDPDGDRVLPTAHRSIAIDPVGSFDSPEGPGKGNGMGGSKGARKLVANAGFGDGDISSGQPGGPQHNGEVHAGVFSNKAVNPAAARAPVHVAKPEIQPVDILDKPEPVYTAAARAHKIQGSVLLDVIFTASDTVQVLRVVRGLGYGLDQAAISAARRIRFRPERVNGKPESVHARLRIVFQLAY